jgi:hypothetical protein
LELSVLRIPHLRRLTVVVAVDTAGEAVDTAVAAVSTWEAAGTREAVVCILAAADILVVARIQAVASTGLPHMEWAVTGLPGAASQGTVPLDIRDTLRLGMHILLAMRLASMGLPVEVNSRLVTAWPALATGLRSTDARIRRTR